MSADERWAPIPGFPGYEASTHGRIRTLKRGSCAIKSLAPDRKGYPRVSMRDASNNRVRLRVHNLILLTFSGPRPVGAVARHYPDRTRSNVRADNLSWGTPAENSADMIAHGMSTAGERHYAAKLTDAAIVSILSDSISSHTELAAKHGVSVNYVYQLRAVRTPRARRALRHFMSEERAP